MSVNHQVHNSIMLKNKINILFKNKIKNTRFWIWWFREVKWTTFPSCKCHLCYMRTLLIKIYNTIKLMGSFKQRNILNIEKYKINILEIIKKKLSIISNMEGSLTVLKMLDFQGFIFWKMDQWVFLTRKKFGNVKTVTLYILNIEEMYAVQFQVPRMTEFQVQPSSHTTKSTSQLHWCMTGGDRRTYKTAHKTRNIKIY